MRIGVIGAGGMGGLLARHLAKLGHHVSIANVPDSVVVIDIGNYHPERAEEEARIRRYIAAQTPAG